MNGGHVKGKKITTEWLHNCDFWILDGFIHLLPHRFIVRAEMVPACKLSLEAVCYGACWRDSLKVAVEQTHT